MNKVLVTGGLGYIGSHTVVELLNEGFDVVVIDNLCNSKIEVKDHIKSIANKDFVLVEGDVTDEGLLSDLIESHQIEGVIHFAAHKAVGESVELPTKYYQNNISGLISVLSVMESAGLNNLIFSSSCTVYGQTTKLPVTEESPIQHAESPYGTTKIICEEIIEDMVKYKDIKSILLRYFNPIGAHPTGKIGELPLGVPSNLVPFITQTAAGIREQITVFGDDYNTPDGTCIRDYIHVVDLAKAHVKALMYSENMKENIDVFNLGTGNGNSVLEAIKTFEKVNGLALNYSIGPRRSGDVEQIWADTNKANNILNWKAELSLKDMMRDAWNWQKSLS